jgi:hypothetical protein
MHPGGCDPSVRAILLGIFGEPEAEPGVEIDGVLDLGSENVEMVEPLRWSLRDPRRQTLWGAPAPRSWFEQGSPFTGQAVREPQFVADVLVAD